MLHLHLTDGSTHETDPSRPTIIRSRLSITPMCRFRCRRPTTRTGTSAVGQMPRATCAIRRAGRRSMSRRWYLIEFHRRFALPTACMVLALVGIPLGLSSKKVASRGVCADDLLVFAYYSVSLMGVSLARQGKVSPALGVWLANIVFFLGGAFLLWRAERRPLELGSFRAKWTPLKTSLVKGQRACCVRPCPRTLFIEGRRPPRIQRQLPHDPGRLRPARLHPFIWR